MNTKQLCTFLLKANQAGYASGNSKKWIKEKDKSTTIVFKSGDWSMHDNFFGGEPYGGREMVFYKNRPFWIMVYYGWVKKGINPKEIYPFLQKALARMPKNAPYRGPKSLVEKPFRYTNQWKGTVDSFSGQESIYKNKTHVYRANYMGGVVDQRKG